MSAQAVRIRRLSATTRLASGEPGDAARVDRLLRGVADQRLERALREGGLPAGTWCVRRLDVPVRLDLRRPDAALETAWAAAIAGALRRALTAGSGEVMRYPRDRDAVADLVCGAATGHLEWAWAWTRMGLLSGADPRPDQDPGGAIVAVLRRHPQHALGVLAAAARRVGLPALHRVLGPAGWAAVAGVVRAALAGAAAAQPPPGPGGRAEPTDRDVALAGTLVAASGMAELIRGSRIRPDARTLDAWALLVVAEADASALRRRAGEAIAAAAARALAGSAPPGPRATARKQAPWRPPEGWGPPPGHGDGEEPAVTRRPPRRVQPSGGHGTVRDARPTSARPAPDADDRSPTAPVPGPPRPGGASTDQALPRTPDADDARPGDGASAGRPTDWAGLLFLLATAGEAGIPDAAIDDPVFATRSLPWVLQGVALDLVPVTAADPAVAAFTGLDPDGPPPWRSGRAATTGERARLTAIAGRWAAATALALGDDEHDPAEVVAALARRRGRIDYVPGWIDVHLDLEQVDVAVRRAGLDLDPGWVPWLGVVLRFVYA